MKIRLLSLTVCILTVCSIPSVGQPCTSFCLDKGNQLVVGINLDYIVGDGLVIVNKRNVSKTAMLRPEWAAGQPASWTSKYGSVTFSLTGLELPWGGINEAGLVVGTMSLETTEYPEPDSRPSFFVVQWTQYQLDNFSTVQEVITSDSQIRIALKTPAGIHFLVSDRMGNCAVIEFIGGKMVYYTKETMPVKTLTNSTYAESIKYWKKGKSPIPDPYLSVRRFITSADMVKAYDPTTSGAAVDYAFDILTNVSQGTVEEIDGVLIKSFLITEWSIVYDIKNLRVYFRTFENKRIRYINVSSFDFSCKTPVKVLDIHEDLSGDVSSKFINYTYKINRELVGKTSRSVLATFFPIKRNIDQQDKVLDDIAKYPETTVCTDK